MSSSTSPSFASLHPRPPTPPKDSISTDVDDALLFLEEGHRSPTKEKIDIRSKVVVGTPPLHSPATSQPGSGGGKRVDFSPWPIYHNPPQVEQRTLLRPSMVKQAPYSRPLKPLKSILKLASTPSPLTPDDIERQLGYFSPEKPESFEKMLQSVLHQLASPNRSARLDAYIALNGSLKAYEGMPDPRAMVARIPLLTQFLSRDMVWKDSKGVLDTNIVSQSLQLACAILYNPQTSQALDDDFRAFLIDRSIFVLEQTDISKGIMKTHLYLLSQQRVYTGILTTHQIEKILNAVKTIEERCSGNSAVAARLIVYQRLLEQAAVVMLNKMNEWVENMLHGLLSSNKDIRLRAIDACSKAGIILGTYQQASKTLNQVLETEIEEGQSFGDYFNARLVNMIADSDVGPDVPRIWASVILMFRCKRRPIHKWPKFKDWLVTIQKCFNSSDLAIKQQASLAWNRLVFAVMPDSTTSDICRSMLRVPIATSLEKSGLDRQSQLIRQFALDSYYNLLHYALRPGLSHQELDMAWDMYVQSVLTTIVKSSTKGPQQACRILSGLLNKTKGAWNINAAMETEAIKPEELPRLDIRWVRSRLRRVIKLFEPILNSALQSSTGNSLFADAWTALWQTIAEAGSQEVRTSVELKDAMAQITNLFGRVWRNGSKLHAEADPTNWCRRFHEYLRITVETLGSGPFVEDVLSKTTDDEVEASPTPSNRLSKGHNDTHSPLVFLFSLYYQPPPGIKVDDTYRNSASWLIHFLTAAKVSTVERLHILTQIIQHCPQLCASDVPANISQQLWTVAARKATDLMATMNLVSDHEAQSVGIAIRHAMTIMTKGLQLSSLNEDNLEAVLGLLDEMCNAADRRGGNGAVLLAVTEPIAQILMNNIDTIRITVTSQLTIRLLERSTWPKDRLDLEGAYKALYAVSPEPMRAAASEPFKNLSYLVTETSSLLYRRGFKDTTHDMPLAFLNALNSLLERCPATVLTSVMQRLQSGLSVWFQDPDRHIFPDSRTPPCTVADRLERQTGLIASREIVPLWSKILATVDRSLKHDSALLQSVDRLMLGGLSSPSKDIVNSTIIFWNDTFGTQTSLEYPETLLPVLRARMEQTEMSVPSLPPRKEDEPVIQLPAFESSQPEVLSPLSSSISRPRNRTPLLLKHSFPKKGDRTLTPGHVSRSGKTSTVKARLRHDDSQIDFEPIASSPLPHQAASQLLTTHQKDVRDEQQANAQMFPDFSSSPNVPLASLVRDIPQAPDLPNSPGIAEEGIIEMTPQPSDGNVMSDDLPSSPTPRAMNKPAAIDEVDDIEIDPPSSPPGRTDGDWIIRRGPLFGPKASPDANADVQEPNTGTIDLSLAQVANDQEPEMQEPPVDDVVEEIVIPSSVEVPDGRGDIDGVTDAARQEVVTGVNHILDEHAEPQRTTDSEIEVKDNSQQSQRGSRKRKRASGTKPAEKKRAHPLQPASVPPRSDLDDADDEIVVVPREGPSLVTRLVEEEIIPTEPSPAQRRSGRKRKSDTSQLSEPSPVVQNKLRRSASVLSNVSLSQRAAPAAAEESPASPKIRKQQRNDDVKTADLAQQRVQTKRTTKRQLAAVVIPDNQPRHSNARTSSLNDRRRSEAEEESVAGSDGMSPDTQLTQEHSMAVYGRRIAQPQSIIARLRDVLVDCKNMIFGSQEEREMDDVLFELRREVHEAGRRGRNP